MSDELKHVLAYGVSNTVTCSCGWRCHTAHGQDLDLEVDVHLGLKPPSVLLDD